jgi:hypothetical protein
MVFEQEAYVGDSELLLVGAPTSIPNVLASKQDSTGEVTSVDHVKESVLGSPV